MNADMKVVGYGGVMNMLRNIADRVPETARGQMKRASERVVELAKLQAPEDEDNLVDSIRIEKSYGTRGRLQIDIVAGNQTVVNDFGRTIDLNTYALMVHEAYETQVATNRPGENTRRKMTANPDIKIGSGFLRRALEKEQKGLERVMIRAIEKVIREEQV